MSLQKLAEFLKESEQTFHEFDVHYFAKKASDNYIKSKTPLNDSIKKIAEENNLNDEYVKRVCETANHNVNQHLFDTQEDKNIYFKVAEAEVVLQKPAEKVAEYSDYDFSPREYREKIAELDTDRARQWGATGAIGLGGVSALNSTLKRGVPGLVSTGVASGIGYGAGRLAHRLFHGPATGKELNPPQAITDPSQLHGKSDEEVLRMLESAPNLKRAYPSASINDDLSGEDSPEESMGEHRKALSMHNLHPKLKEFHENSLRKMASIDFTIDVDISSIDPNLTLLALKEKIASMKQDIEDKLYMNEFKIKEANYNLYKVAKEELKSAPYYKIAQAIAMTTDNHSILEDITEQLWDQHLISEDDMLTIVKTAGELDTTHPIVTWTKKYASLLEEIDLYSRAKIEAEDQLKLIQENLKF